MSAPFQPGDVAVCIDDHPELPPDDWQPLRASYYRILDCFFGVADDGEEGWAVELAEDPYPNGDGYPAYDFRKIDDEVTEDFRQQMHSLGKPKKIGETVG